MSYEYDFLIFIGRLAPPHIGHIKVIQEALKRASRVGIILGSCGGPRSLRNPFTADERSDMIFGAFAGQDQLRIDFVEAYDHAYNDDAWIEQIQHLVKDLTWKYETGKPLKIGLIGHAKDHTSYYLKLFPQWGSVNVPQEVIYSSTNIRTDYFTANAVIHHHIVPKSTSDFLQKFCTTQAFKELVAEQTYVTKYRASWAGSPYPPVFVTADAVVTQSGHVLLIRRKASPGRGLLAIPGGFLDPNETILQGAIRELYEETKIKIKPEDLPTPKVRVYDNPHRSERGRVITHAHHFALPPTLELPKVKGGSDANKAFWTPMANLDPKDFFEDHYGILMSILELN